MISVQLDNKIFMARKIKMASRRKSSQECIKMNLQLISALQAYRVHLSKYFVDPFFGRVLVLRQIKHVSHHAVDSVHNVDHFLLRDVTIVVQVIQVEGPCRIRQSINSLNAMF